MSTKNVCRTVEMKGTICHTPGIEISGDDEVAVSCEEGVFILDFEHMFMETESGMPYKLSKVVLDDTADVTLGINRDKVSAMDFVEIATAEQLHVFVDRTLSPDFQSLHPFHGVKTAKWSPAYADNTTRCALAVLRLDHILFLAKRAANSVQWNVFVNLGDLFATHCKKTKFKLLAEEARNDTDDYKAKKYAVSAIDMAWHPRVLFQQTTGVDKQLPADEDEQRAYTFLAVAMKSGHLVLWRTGLPLAEETISLEKVVQPSSDIPYRICWCRVQAQSGIRDFLLLGYVEGRILAVDSASGDVTSVWAEQDRLSVLCLCWHEDAQVLLAAKGPYVLMARLTLQSTGQLEIETAVSQPLSRSAVVTGISYAEKQDVFISVGDGYVLKAKWDGLQNLQLQCEGLYIPRTKGAWKRDGAVHSRSGVLYFIVESAADAYAQCRMKNSFFLHVLSTLSDDVIGRRLSQLSSGSLRDSHDLLVYVKYLVTQESPPRWPQQVQAILPDKALCPDVAAKLPLLQLKLKRYLLQLAILSDFQKKQAEYQKALDVIEAEVTKRYLVDVLDSFLSEYKSSRSQPSEQDLTVVCLACQALATVSGPSTCPAVQTVLARFPVLRERIHTDVERCRVCEELVTVSSWKKDTCRQGHEFARCVLTLSLCSEIPYRRCQWCGVLACRRPKQGTKWTRQILENDCPLCDGKIL